MRPQSQLPPQQVRRPRLLTRYLLTLSVLLEPRQLPGTEHTWQHVLPRSSRSGTLPDRSGTLPDPAAASFPVTEPRDRLTTTLSRLWN